MRPGEARDLTWGFIAVAGRLAYLAASAGHCCWATSELGLLPCPACTSPWALTSGALGLLDEAYLGFNDTPLGSSLQGHSHITITVICPRLPPLSRLQCCFGNIPPLRAADASTGALLGLSGRGERGTNTTILTFPLPMVPQ